MDEPLLRRTDQTVALQRGLIFSELKSPLSAFVWSGSKTQSPSFSCTLVLGCFILGAAAMGFGIRCVQMTIPKKSEQDTPVFEVFPSGFSSLS